MPINSIKEAREIVKFVEGDDGLPRLDNMIREDRYAEAKISLAAMGFPEIKALVECLEDVQAGQITEPALGFDWNGWHEKTRKALFNFNRAVGKGE